jgi:hypothetical protein
VTKQAEQKLLLEAAKLLSDRDMLQIQSLRLASRLLDVAKEMQQHAKETGEVLFEPKYPN